jgi:hypothetical protein
LAALAKAQHKRAGGIAEKRRKELKTRIALAVAVAFALAFTLATIARADDVKVEGKWEAKFTTPQGDTRTTTYTFKQEGKKLTGTVSGGMGGDATLTGSVDGDEVKFTVVRQTPNGERKTEYKVKVEGDTMKGKVETQRGSIDWSATKVK